MHSLCSDIRACLTCFHPKDADKEDWANLGRIKLPAEPFNCETTRKADRVSPLSGRTCWMRKSAACRKMTWPGRFSTPCHPNGEHAAYSAQLARSIADIRRGYCKPGNSPA